MTDKQIIGLLAPLGCGVGFLVAFTIILAIQGELNLKNFQGGIVAAAMVALTLYEMAWHDELVWLGQNHPLVLILAIAAILSTSAWLLIRYWQKIAVFMGGDRSRSFSDRIAIKNTSQLAFTIWGGVWMLAGIALLIYHFFIKK